MEYQPQENKTKILVVTHCFAPQGVSGALRMLRFCRYLPSYGIHPIVLTVQARFYAELDDTCPPLDGFQIERTVMQGTPLDWYRHWKRRRSPVGSTPEAAAPRPVPIGERFWFRQVVAVLQAPDPHWGWYRPAVRAAKKLLARESVSAILSSGPPWTSHLVAKRLSRRYRLPWLADFRDPWGQNPGQADLPRWRQALNRWLEARCIRQANLVLCNTDRMRDSFVRQYVGCPPEKFVVLTNGFDDPVISHRDNRPKKDRRLLLHLGSLYVGRRIDTFCEAVSDLIREGKLQPGSFYVLFLGDQDPSLIAAAEQRTPELVRNGTIVFRKRVGWHEAQEKLWEADVLLLFQGSLTMEVPAKIFEYLSTGKPILSMVKEGALSELVRLTSAGECADPDDPSDIAQKLQHVLEQPPRDPLQAQQELYDRFHYRSLTSRLAGLIRHMIGDTSERS